MNYLDFIISAQKSGQARGITAVCSAHPFVLEAALRHGLAHEKSVLIEVTCNQVNQFGGYTGMKPADFVHFVQVVADRVGFPHQNLILGGDHIGPQVWVNEPAIVALEKAKTLVSEYVRAGFGKIHLDCSMPCADDTELTAETIVRRVAELAKVAESVGEECHSTPRYVIGTEVPPAGGANAWETHLSVTHPADVSETIDLTRLAFSSLGLDAALERVIATTVQLGVEFGDESIHEYDRSVAAGLKSFIEGVPGLIYEAHSTDYQTRSALRAMVEDHFGILKVGPRLTYTFRQAVFALSEIENILAGGTKVSKIREALESAMLNNPVHWHNHYTGTPERQKFKRFYSFSDRIRYYWTVSEVRAAFDYLLANLGDGPLPLSLVSEYLPRQYEQIRSGEIKNHPRALLLGRVVDVLEDYRTAC